MSGQAQDPDPDHRADAALSLVDRWSAAHGVEPARTIASCGELSSLSCRGALPTSPRLRIQWRLHDYAFAEPLALRHRADVPRRPWRPWRVASRATYRSQAGEGSLYLSDTRLVEDPVADRHGGNHLVAAVVTLHECGRLWVFLHVDQLVWRAGES